jgi:mycothiol synthase
MNGLPDGYTLRPASREDAAAVAEVIAAADEADGAPRDTELSDIEQFWRELDPTSAALVAVAPDGALVGYVDVLTVADRTHVDGYVHPSARGRGVGVSLLRAGEHMADGAPVLRTTVVGGATDSEQLVAQEGYKHIRSFFRMRIHLDERPPQPDWPDGFELRGYRPGTDDRALHELLQDAFRDHWEHEPRTLDEFVHNFARSDQLVPEASFMLFEADEAVGGVLSMRRFGTGWIQSLGVRQPWRKRGIGLALLRQAFGALYGCGERSIGLGVDAESPTGATRLYERAGMHVEVRYDTYEKRVRVG